MAKNSHHRPASALLVGRVNVGKSTLFNRILSQHRAITSNEAGTTRDINRALADWRGQNFWLTDSGGFDSIQGDDVSRLSRKQLEREITEAAVVLLVVDGQTGLLPQDRELARRLRTLKANCILVVNKADSPAKRTRAEAISLGFPDTVLVSAQTGSGVGDLLDLVIQHLPETLLPQAQLTLALLGQTNVGKSSLFNALLKAERSLVLPSPHTTRDRLHDYLEHGAVTLELIDTAGLRRQHQRAPKLEQLSAQQSLAALKQIEVALLTLDGSRSPTWQDQHIGQLIVEARVATVVLLNKSDLVPFDERKAAVERLRRWLPMAAWAQTLWVSGLKAEGVQDIIPLAEEAARAWRRQLTEAELKTFWGYLKRNATTNRLPLGGFEQTGTRPPSFQLLLRQKADPPHAIGDWVARALRSKYDFRGSPVLVRLEGSRQAG
ncbi:MAG: ribosome biogenesis GTPase Der [Candidatus Veblenbacteria bacterium]|nr:ribosome biogenesis GTPase Der [Candidatus Veblenbacteria bacterium]